MMDAQSTPNYECGVLVPVIQLALRRPQSLPPRLAAGAVGGVCHCAGGGWNSRWEPLVDFGRHLNNSLANFAHGRSHSFDAIACDRLSVADS